MKGSYLYKGTGSVTIRYWMGKRNLTSANLMKALNISKPTFYIYIKNPFLMTLGEISIIAGLFGIALDEFVYCLARNRAKIDKAGKWYLEGERLKGDKAMNQGL